MNSIKHFTFNNLSCHVLREPFNFKYMFYMIVLTHIPMCYVPLQIADAVAMDETTSSSLSSTTSSSRASTPIV